MGTRSCIRRHNDVLCRLRACGSISFSSSTAPPSFDKKDPLFDLDISFYVFKLDFIEEVNQIVIVLLIAFAVLTIIYYSVLLSMRTPKIFEKEAQDAGSTADDGPDLLRRRRLGIRRHGRLDGRHVRKIRGDVRREGTGRRFLRGRLRTRAHSITRISKCW